MHLLTFPWFPFLNFWLNWLVFFHQIGASSLVKFHFLISINPSIWIRHRCFTPISFLNMCSRFSKIYDLEGVDVESFLIYFSLLFKSADLKLKWVDICLRLAYNIFLTLLFFIIKNYLNWLIKLKSRLPMLIEVQFNPSLKMHVHILLFINLWKLTNY